MHRQNSLEILTIECEDVRVQRWPKCLNVCNHSLDISGLYSMLGPFWTSFEYLPVHRTVFIVSTGQITDTH